MGTKATGEAHSVCASSVTFSFNIQSMFSSQIRSPSALRVMELIVSVDCMARSTKWGEWRCLWFQAAHSTYFEMTPASGERPPAFPCIRCVS